MNSSQKDALMIAKSLIDHVKLTMDKNSFVEKEFCEEWLLDMRTFNRLYLSIFRREKLENNKVVPIKRHPKFDQEYHCECLICNNPDD